MLASVHIADIGARAALEGLRKSPSAGGVRGLRHSNVGLAATLNGVVALPSVGRLGLLAFWDDDASCDQFLLEHPLARLLEGGFRVRLKPLRASGTWPGLPTTTPKTQVTKSEGPVASLTLGRLRFTQTVRFLRASAKAEASVLRAEGLLWVTALAAPPFVSTFALWRDARSLMTYAYGRRDPAHMNAIAAAAAKPFHHESAFIRFQPYASEGQLSGKNPLAATLLHPSSDAPALAAQ